MGDVLPVSRQSRTLQRLIAVGVLVLIEVSLPACMTPPRKLCLSGCVNSASIRANRLARSCRERVADRVAYRTISKRVPIDALETQPEQMLNERRPSRDEAESLSSMQRELIACRKLVSAASLHPDPRLIELILQSQRDSDHIIDELINRRLSWGQANRRRFALATALLAQVRRATAVPLNSPATDLGSSPLSDRVAR
jgi:hypothetical protein